jgi:hypothetical protein
VARDASREKYTTLWRCLRTSSMYTMRLLIPKLSEIIAQAIFLILVDHLKTRLCYLHFVGVELAGKTNISANERLRHPNCKVTANVYDIWSLQQVNKTEAATIGNTKAHPTFSISIYSKSTLPIVVI